MAVSTYDWAELSQQLVRWWRGEKTQLEASVELGLRSNVFSGWERGAAQPRGSLALRCARYAGRPVDDLIRLLGGRWSEDIPLDSREGVALLTGAIVGKRTVREVAEQAGLSRHALARYANAQAEAPLSALLAVIATTGKLRPVLEILCEPAELPLLASTWAEHALADPVFENAPQDSDVYLLLYLDAYAALPAHQPGWIASRLGLSLEEEQASLQALLARGLVELVDGRYEPVPEQVGHFFEPDAEQRLRKRAWMRRRIFQGRLRHQNMSIGLVTQAEALRIKRILVECTEEVNRILTLSEGREEAITITVGLRTLAGPET